MRTKSAIDQIKNYPGFGQIYSVPWAFSDEVIEGLITYFEEAEKLQKVQGPVTVDILPQDWDHPLLAHVLRTVKKKIGDCDVASALFFKTDTPHIIHNDDTFELPPMYKGITIPLKNYPKEGKSMGCSDLVFFDQYYFGGPAKFFKGSTNMKSHFNKPLYDYSEVEGLTNKPFNVFARGLVPHLKDAWIEGLSVKAIVPQVPGSYIVFDPLRLHCATDFRKEGIKSKLVLSIFTKQKV